MRTFAAQLRPALVSLLVLSAITGLAYPLLMTGVAQTVFPWRANGSPIAEDGRARGSALIGQPFDDPRYFWGRLSATAVHAYNAFDAEALAGSSGSNLGPRNPALAAAVQARVDALRAADPEACPPYPADLVTASGSGLDPQISPAAAEYQVRRVAQARGLAEEQVRRLVAEHTEGRDLGVLGEPRVNVLRLNLALDRLPGRG
jgi:K+-transporting ATPase ATPase C chain